MRGTVRDWFKQLGPGLITGAADDDPSGIATYSQAGAQFGFLTLADRLMISVYGLSVYSLVVTIGLVTLSDEKRLHAVQRLNELSWIVFPVASFVLIIVQFLI